LGCGGGGCLRIERPGFRKGIGGAGGNGAIVEVPSPRNVPPGLDGPACAELIAIGVANDQVQIPGASPQQVITSRPVFSTL
jgi:hypothetical protein